MTLPTLHYLYDPLCGWCYAAEPLVRAAAAAGVPLALHGGGLWDPAVHATDAKRQMMCETDARIARLTGQVFGPAYFDRLLVDPRSVWWSRPTVAAILAAERLDARAALPMLVALQRAHYVEGRRIVERNVLAALAREIDVDVDAFVVALDAVPVDEHIRDTRAIMRRHGLQGYPSFLLERGDVLERLAHEGCYGDPEAFVAQITGDDPTGRLRATG